MKLILGRDGIEIHAETAQDTAYIEDTLGLKKAGDFVNLRRKNYVHENRPDGLDCLTTVRRDE